MTRCIGCGRRIWFWQSSGWLVSIDNGRRAVTRWHGVCWEQVYR